METELDIKPNACKVSKTNKAVGISPEHYLQLTDLFSMYEKCSFSWLRKEYRALVIIATYFPFFI